METRAASASSNTSLCPFVAAFFLTAKALDLFLANLLNSTVDVATQHGAKIISTGHL